MPVLNRWNGTTWEEVGASGIGTTGLLAVKTYAAGTDTVIGITSLTFVDVDATNLVITFTAPASGKVLVRLSVAAQISGPSNGYWGLREGSTTVAQGLSVSTNAEHANGSSAYHITGLTPSASYTYKWAAKVSGSTQQILTGPGWGAAVMEVWAAPA